MEIRILGPLEVADETGVITLPGGRARALLAVLATSVGQVVSTDRLIDELWGPAPPPTARTKLQGLISAVRKQVEPHRPRSHPARIIETRPPGYLLALDPDSIDAHRFRRLVAESAQAPAEERAATLRRALGLWRGPALADFTYEPFAQGDITALRELWLVAVEARIDAELELGGHAALIAELERLVGDQPFRESLRTKLMLALYRCGRQTEALDVYRDARVTLAEELGIEPGPELQELEQAILSHEPSLRSPSSPAAAVGGSWLPDSRKPVTVVFAELIIVSDDALAGDPEVVRRLVGRAYETARRVLTRHGGTVEGFIGDVVVAVFGAPTAHEDDPLRALRAAAELRRALAELDGEDESRPRMTGRIGVNSGEVVVGHQPASGTGTAGDPVNVTARLQQAAGPGEVLMGDSTRRLVGEAVVVGTGENLATPGQPSVQAWPLLEIVEARTLVGRSSDPPFLGRDGELARLEEVFADVVSDQVAALVAVTGEAGMGKTRLVREWARSVAGRASVLSGTCPAYGDGITFRPVRELVADAAREATTAGIESLLGGDSAAGTTAGHIAGALSLTDDHGDPAEIFPAFRRLFERMAEVQPVVAVLDDIHWAEPTLLDLIEYLGDTVRAPLLVVCVARPELLEDRQGWGTGGVTTIRLEPLDQDASRSLVAERLVEPGIPPGSAERVIEMGQGNPLFLEQMAAAVRDGDSELMPATVMALLVARLDRLGPAERDLLRCAAVMGSEFSVAGIVALIPQAEPHLHRYLASLEERQLVRRSEQSGGDGYSFRHVLVQVAAYRSMTLETRAALHERFADWMEAEARGMIDGEAVIGHHLEKAWRLRGRIGLADERTEALAVRAGGHLASEGIRAFARLDAPAAAGLLARATALLPRSHPRRTEILSRLSELYPMLGRHEQAAAVLVEVMDGADDVSRLRIGLEMARIRLITGPHTVQLDVIEREAREAWDVFERAGNHAGASLATYVVGLIHLWRGEVRQMEEVAWRGLAHADRSRQPREELAARWWVALALVNGPRPVSECVAACGDLAEWSGGEHVGVLAELARLHAMQGSFDQARGMLARSRELLMERVRARRPLMFVLANGAEVDVLAGETDAALAGLQEAMEMANDMGEPPVVSQLAARLSRLLPADSAEADRLASVSAASAPVEDVHSQAMWRAARARLLVAGGSRHQAERLAREAVEKVPPDMANLAAELRVDLGRVLAATRGMRAGDSVIGDAIELYRRKGNLTAAEAAGGVPIQPSG